MKNRVGKGIKNLWRDESGQGATEYILLLVIVVGVAMLFKKEITSIVGTKLGELSSGISGITSN
ncbi:Flp1 family type IVb pilin [Bdellovibrionales bacterium]|nr:Flp1 family type IVb pilin [Bdellovibrionales bacterium]